jgi:maltooligosyltrehalose trehalohydrolase
VTAFELWAPSATTAGVQCGGRLVTLAPSRPGGWWAGDVDGLEHGADYWVLLDGERLPDPRSRRLPTGVHGPSRWWDPSSFRWTDDGWPGLPLEGGSVYELHVGTFTEQGTLDAAIGRLGHLVQLGIRFVELMPVAAFDGDRGWGYDGVAPWSVHEAYGGPDALCRFVDAAHERGLGVILDVVHNHLGPSGAYLPRFGPWFASRHSTPWGDGINLDGEGSDGVRALILDSALALLRDHHLDGLRLDAVHELRDDRATHILEELAEAGAALGEELGRTLHLIAESDRNDPRTVTPRALGGLGIDAQWDDDVHHALHVWLTGDTGGYYADFAEPGALHAVLDGAFLHAGTWSTFRGRTHGRPVDRSRVEPWRFVVSLQTHDQVGNRAFGERLGHLVDDLGRAAAGAALVLASPFTPMLFMGEEWGASTPWQFFSSFPDPGLGRAVTEGRRAEMSAHSDEFGGDDVPDPQDPATRGRSVLGWAEREEPPHDRLLRWYAALLHLRAREPALAACTWDGYGVRTSSEDVWAVLARQDLRVVAARAAAEVVLDSPADQVLLAWDDDVEVQGSTVRLARAGAVVVRTA